MWPMICAKMMAVLERDFFTGSAAFLKLSESQWTRPQIGLKLG